MGPDPRAREGGFKSSALCLAFAHRAFVVSRSDPASAGLQYMYDLIGGSFGERTKTMVKAYMSRAQRLYGASQSSLRMTRFILTGNRAQPPH